MEQNKNARGYCRVSTTMQVQDGVSLETQEKRITSYCSLMGFNLIKIYKDEGISGKTIKDRPDFQNLLNDISKDDRVIVCDLTRFSRDTIDALSTLKLFNTKGVFLISIDDNIDFSTPMGKMTFGILTLFAELSRETTAANISTNMQRLSREGKLRTRPPFGWKFVSKDQDLEIVPSQQECIEKIKQMYLSGMKIAHITKALNANGMAKCLNDNKRNVKPELNPQFYDQTVRRILIDHKLIQEEKPVVNLESRIVSQHKES
jgi:site-specific DNA recombinase